MEESIEKEDPNAWMRGKTEDEIDTILIRELKHHFDIDKDEGGYKIAKYLVERYSIRTIGEREREMFMYDRGVYVPGNNFIRKWLHDLLEVKCKTHTRNEILEKVKDLSMTDRNTFTVDKNFINLENGVFDLQKYELTPHNPIRLFLNKIPTSYVSEVDCPAIKKFLHEILDNESIKVIQEFVGFGLYRQYFIKKALILVGEPNTGKTTLLRIIHSLFGKDNRAGVSLQKITTDKFSAAELYHRHINTFDDLSFKDINDTGAFKIVTGGGSITAEHKFKSPFQFENYAKLIYACNKIPDVKMMDDDAYFSRWIIVRFNKQVEKVDNFLVEKLTTSEEMTGLLNFALEGLRRLLLQRAFSYPMGPEEIKLEMMRSSPSLASFVSTCLVKDPDSWVSKDDLYFAFKQYAMEHNIVVLTKENLGKKLQGVAPYIDPAKKTVNGKQVTGWHNVKIISHPLKKEESKESRDSILF